MYLRFHVLEITCFCISKYINQLLIWQTFLELLQKLGTIVGAVSIIEEQLAKCLKLVVSRPCPWLGNLLLVLLSLWFLSLSISHSRANVGKLLIQSVLVKIRIVGEYELFELIQYRINSELLSYINSSTLR